tara:strand:- start:2420 stop:2800 length:381 start_codon:yes stop_codon:yes gene_type:complete
VAQIGLIEDDKMIRDTLQRILKRMGHTVATASNGREGLDTVRKVKCDLVITDIIMPEIEGIEVIRTLKNEQPELKVIAMSGGGRVGNTDFLKIAQTLGADAIVYKPVTKKEFMHALNGCLGVETPA